ncbi:hypothetical protein POM88_049869 [Heracleum sosnowskyi]|uniref:SWIM-type domain-containing protein n=1 Tax=Heracleum sosnowskyi TaxID=360622 RepID=A0AAD8M234_9APIA|nr:hypothetical protein POM88_049869 [Heracleum sosnowskyi]
MTDQQKGLKNAIDNLLPRAEHRTGADECEVRDIDGGQWVVNMTRKTCSCRRWELRGYPCSHGCAALFAMNERPEDNLHARRMPGRPKKNRRREQGEPGAGVKLGKKGVIMRERRRQQLKKKKQNRESGQGANEGQQPKRKRGRPTKAGNVQVLPPPPPLPPPGVGVYVFKDGTIQVSSQPV